MTLTRTTQYQYEALLTAVREALHTASDGNCTNRDAREAIECILIDVLKEIGESETE